MGWKCSEAGGAQADQAPTEQPVCLEQNEQRSGH